MSSPAAQPQSSPAVGPADVEQVGPGRAERFHGYLSMQSRGVVALPPALRRRYQLDRPGAQVEVTEREDGVLEVRPVIAVPATEVWFWDARWQTGEREVDAHVRAGEVTVSDSAEHLLAGLAALDEQATTDEDLAAHPARPGGEGCATGELADQE